MKIPTLFAILTLTFMTACNQTEKADLLIHNAKIYTLDGSFSIQEAMAVKKGKIIMIGPDNQLKNRFDAKEVIDAKLRPIYPGFIDAHCHFLWYGNTFFEVDLVGTKSWEEVIERTKKFSAKNSDLWITGRGWDQNDWELQEFPSKSELDRLFPNRAVLLKRIDGHAAIANKKALEIANINVNSKVDGGIFELKNGSLTGLLIDNAVDSVSQAIPKLTNEQMERALLKAQEMCFAKGLTTVDDAMLENKMVHVIDRLQKDGSLKMKIYGMLVPSEKNKTDFLLNGPYQTDHLTIRSFKYFADGALGSRGAKLLSPYHDDPTNDGLFLNDSSYFAQEAALLYKNGFQMNTHCIGDAANRLILSIYGQTLKETNDRRWRIEHAQIIHPEDLRKFKDFTIIPSVQPTHATSDMPWLKDRLGEERLSTAYPYQELLQQNGIIALGTDFPIEDIDPIKTFYAAVVRKDIEGKPEGGFQTDNALTREEALKGMTIWAAISNFEEESKGSIEVGKSADFIILNQDIMKVDADQLLKTKVLQTFSDGEQVYQQASSK